MDAHALEDLGLLRTFVRIADCGGISAAARASGMNQPTISRRLRQLERAAGVPLIRRDTRTMSLTAAGRRLLEDARGLLDFAETARQRLKGDRETVGGHLRIVAVVDFGQWLVAPLLARFRAAHPAVTAELHFVNRPVKFVEEGFDCGILVGKVTDATVTARHLARIERWLVAAPALLAAGRAPSAPADLAELPWIGIVQPQFYARDRVSLTRGGRSATVELEPSLLFDGVTAARQAVLEGAGFALQPSWLVRQAVADGRLIRLLPGWVVPAIAAQIVYPTANVQTARLRSFVDFMLQGIADALVAANG